MRRPTLAVLVALSAALAVPAVAFAHATLVDSYPRAQTTVQVPPKQVRLVFNQSVSVTPRAIQVFAVDGTVLSGAATTQASGTVVVAPASRLEKGKAYTVRWRVTSSDGHSPGGVFTFGVGVPAPPPTEAVGAGGTTWRDDVARWVLFASLALLIGPLVVRMVVLRGATVPTRLEQRFHVLTTVAAFLVVDAGIVAFVIRASNALQLPGIDLLYGDLQPFAEKTRFGLAFLVMTLGFGVVAGLLLVAWVFDRLALRWPALVLAMTLASGLSLSGHQATEPNSTKLSELADYLHLVSASIWVGGLTALALLVWSAAPALRRAAFLGFARLAVVLVGLMVLGGAYLALVRLPTFSDLWTTQYGRVLLLKALVVGLALAWGAVHHFLVRPRLEAGGDPRVRPSLIGEMVVAFVALLVAAVLTNSSPPPVREHAPTAARPAR